MHIARPALLFILVTPLVTADKQPNPFNIPAEGYNFTAGHASTITWKPTTEGDVTLRLRSGPTNDLDQGIVIAAHIHNSGSYSFTPPTDSDPNAAYTIEISDDQDSSLANYTPRFVIAPSTTSTRTATTPVSTAAAATAGAASSSTVPSEGQRGGGLPFHAKLGVGLGVGMVLGLIACVLIVYWLVRWCIKRRATRHQPPELYLETVESPRTVGGGGEVTKGFK